MSDAAARDTAGGKARARKAAVLAGGPAEVSARLKRALVDVDLVIAADAGVGLADALGLTPDLWVGDFDSASEDQRRRHAALPRREHPRDKDALDLELAVDEALREGAGELVLAGVFGGRLDQTVAALLIGSRLRAEEGVAVRLFGGSHECHPLTRGDAVDLALPEGTLFSLVSLEGEAIVDVRGARFELSAARLPFGVGLGVSNRAADDGGGAGGPHVRVREGRVVALIEWGESAA